MVSLSSFVHLSAFKAAKACSHSRKPNVISLRVIWSAATRRSFHYVRLVEHKQLPVKMLLHKYLNSSLVSICDFRICSTSRTWEKLRRVAALQILK